MLKVLITGANGQLGQSLLKRLDSQEKNTWIPTDFKELDITDSKVILDFTEHENPGLIINCAAYTAVDQAESEAGKAMLINGTGAGNLARQAALLGIPLIHISTDFVFSGSSNKPYTETDPTGPLSVYGRSKLAGEKAVQDARGSSIILRTSWLYSEFGNNFLLTMLRLGREKESLGVVMDQTGSPTYAGDLADGILQIIRHHQKESSWPAGPALYHFCDSGIASWYDLAHEIMHVAKLPCRIKPILTADYPLPAFRPAYSVMNNALFTKTYHHAIPHWSDSLRQCIHQVLNNQSI